MTSPTPFLQLRGRANVLVALLVASALISVLSILYELDTQSLVDQVVAGQLIGEAEAQAADDRTSMVAGLSLAAFVVTAIAFLAWFFRAYVNIERLGARDLRAKKGWSIGVWFIPFLNLIRPKHLMDDIWRASDPELPAGELRGWQDAAVPGLLHGWWLVFLLASFVSNVAGRMVLNADSLPDRASAGELSMIADGGLIVAAVLAVLVVRAVTSRQEGRAARAGSDGPPAASAAEIQLAQPIPVVNAQRPDSIPPPMTSR